jgi:D-cysteine desulfhydrase family pyridoxal phosphate-dependent enzyme
MSEFSRRLNELPRVQLTSLPTPLEHWGNLSRHLGIELYVKRDDLTGIGVGGNKLRKLEFIAGAAQKRGVTHIVTTGGPQSNHARLTAAVAARLGLKCTLLLKGRWDKPIAGNLMLDALFGAKIKLIDAPDYPTIYRAMKDLVEELRVEGETPMDVPLGGASPEGTAGYVGAFAEIVSQLTAINIRADWMVVAGGTGSTYAGLAVGAQVFDPRMKLVGISVSWKLETLEVETRRLASETIRLLRADEEFSYPVRLREDFIGPGYAQISEDGLAAIKLLARLEGIILDTTYTGKALAGLIGLVRGGDIPQGSSVVFVHTGGLPELYTRSAQELGLAWPMPSTL